MPSQSRPESLFLDGPAGRLEALLDAPLDLPARGSALVCHPHPQHGGTMQNKVAHTLARAFVSCGYRALRFNFRGVAASDGSYDNARGEFDDALAAIGYLRRQWPEEPLWLSGFSFGAAIAIRAAIDTSPAGLVSIAPAAHRFVGKLTAQPDCPWLIVHGDQDEVVSVEETIDWVNDLEPGPELQVFPETGHFFHGKLVELRETVAAFVNKQTA